MSSMQTHQPAVLSTMGFHNQYNTEVKRVMPALAQCVTHREKET